MHTWTKRLKPRLPLGTTLLAMALFGGCASDPQKPATVMAPTPSPAPVAATPMAPVAATVTYFAVLPEDERHYLFGDVKTYLAYLQHGEVALTRTRIGASPAGTSVVFGITADDVKENRPNPAEQIFDGKLKPVGGFYGEVFKDGRYYVFSELADMKQFLEHGEAALTFTDIGTGPNGATQVWVMNKDTMAKGRPTATMAMFKALRGGQ
jgi:hypothetical protein